MDDEIIQIYTDGSCNSQYKVGGWAAIILKGDRPITLKGIVPNASHNEMELLAVIKAISHLIYESEAFTKLVVLSDSQYVVGIVGRMEKLKESNFLTAAGKRIPNHLQVQLLIQQIETYSIDFIKVTAHQKKTENVNYNREVDKIVRKMVRDHVREMKR